LVKLQWKKNTKIQQTLNCQKKRREKPVGEDNSVNAHTRFCDLFATPLPKRKHLKSWPSLKSDRKSPGAPAAYTLIELLAGCCWFLVYLFSFNPISPPTHIPILMQTNPHECKHKATKSLNTLSFGIYTTHPTTTHSTTQEPPIRRTFYSRSCSCDFFCCCAWPAAPVPSFGPISPRVCLCLFVGTIWLHCLLTIYSLFAGFVVVLEIKFTSIK